MSAELYAVLVIIIESATLLGSVVLTGAYVTGNPWRNLVGWSLITLVASIDIILVFSVLRRVLDWGQWSGLVQLGLVMVAVWFLAIAFLRMRRIARRVRIAEKDHRIERTES
jgi:hypothetical protein